jgi:putative glutamine amidotransferase
MPVVGLSTALERAQWSVWDQEAMLLSRSYPDAVRRAGGLAVMLPPDPRAQEDPSPWLDLVDALILAGGADVDPGAYGEEPHPETRGTVPERDAFEIALARGAMERDVPLLGICRGMQVMNVARGGTLIQHLPDDVGHQDHRRSLETLHPTKSHHHQGVARIGSGFEVTGWATVDDLPETIEDPACRFALGVQWHPEVDPTSQLIGALVEEARAVRTR